MPIKIITNDNKGIYFYPTPLSEQDLVEAGGYIEPEESKDDVETPGESVSSDGIILDQVISKHFDQDEPDPQIHDLHNQEHVNNDNEKINTHALVLISMTKS